MAGRAKPPFPPHQHTFREVVAYCTGHIRCPVGRETYTGQPGTILITPPGTVHEEIVLTAYSNIWVQFHAPANAPLWPVEVFDDEEQTITRLCALLVREAQARRRGVCNDMSGLLLAQLNLLLLRAGETPRCLPAERLLAEQAFSHDGDGIRDVALAVGVSASTLRLYLKGLRGYSARSYLQRVRLQKAVVLLGSSDLTLQAIADLCGYDSPSHLSRCVKQETGQAPGKIRG